MEHVSSKKLIDKLEEFLDFPRFDPHGDPIPDSHGKIEASRQVCLTELPINKIAIVSNVSDRSTEMLELLKHKKIGIGSKLEVKKKFSFDNSMEIKVNQQMQLNISEQLAKNIFVTSPPAPLPKGEGKWNKN
jgi:DtxR family Mn-dependent transcriptional regulator